jgi:hypothetical protein
MIAGTAMFRCNWSCGSITEVEVGI